MERLASSRSRCKARGCDAGHASCNPTQPGCAAAGESGRASNQPSAHLQQELPSAH